MDAASPAGQDLPEKPRDREPRWGGRRREEPEPRSGVTHAGTSPALATGRAGAGRRATRPRQSLSTFALMPPGIRLAHLNVELTQKSMRAPEALGIN